MCGLTTNYMVHISSSRYDIYMVIWRSGHLAGKTVLKKGKLFAGKNEVPLERHCRPSGPGGK